MRKMSMTYQGHIIRNILIKLTLDKRFIEGLIFVQVQPEESIPNVTTNRVIQKHKMRPYLLQTWNF